MRLLIVHFGPFDCNSAIQAFHFGNLLADRGRQVTLCADGDPAEVARVGEPRFACISHRGLDDRLRKFERDPAETVVLAWTPRERVRRLSLEASRRLSAPYVVHLEDNEEHLLSKALGLPPAELPRLSTAELDARAPTLAHPARSREFLRGAAGVTMITPELNEFNAAGRPHALVRPGVDPDRFHPDVEPPPRSELGLADDDFVIVYHGTLHYANQHEMRSLYLAVQLLRRRGWSVRLVRLGESEFGRPDPHGFRALGESAVELGAVPWRDVPPLLALADAFVQPGAADDFNRYRLPSKLPEFLAMGRPLVLPRCNIGLELEDGRDALLLERGRAPETAARIEQLIENPRLAERLGHAGHAFALERLSWKTNATALEEFLTTRVAA